MVINQFRPANQSLTCVLLSDSLGGIGGGLCLLKDLLAGTGAGILRFEAKEQSDCTFSLSLSVRFSSVCDKVGDFLISAKICVSGSSEES